MDVFSIRIQSLSYSILTAGGSEQIFDNFSASFDIDHNKICILQGSNGIGKSVLAQLIAGMHKLNAGSIELFLRGEKITHSGSVVYIPQNFENVSDRYACDFFSAIASGHSFFFRKYTFINYLLANGFKRKDLNTCCDNLPRSFLVKGVLHALIYSKPELIVLDEPFAQLNEYDMGIVNNLILNCLGNSQILLITHPSQMPDTKNVCCYEICFDQNNQKIFRNFLFQSKTEKENIATESDKVFTIELHEYGRRVLFADIVRNKINNLVAPDFISPGRLASIIVRSLKMKSSVVINSFVVSIHIYGQYFETVSFLPACAQTNIVLNDLPIYLSSLFDAWEAAPSSGFSLLDYDLIKQRLFRESSEIFPIIPDNPDKFGFELSGGNRQMLALRTIISIDHDVIVFVAPFAGLDDVNYNKVVNVLNFMAETGHIIISVDSV